MRGSAPGRFSPLFLFFAFHCRLKGFLFAGVAAYIAGMDSQVIAVIKKAGKRGLLLPELVQRLNRPKKDVERIIESLKAGGYIKEVIEQHDGKPVTRIIWRESGIGWDTLRGCPCFSCPEIDRCGAGQPISPWTCKKLDEWITDRLHSA